jgi:TolB-like protein
MKNFFTLTLILLLSVSSYAQIGQQKASIAIVDFQNTSSNQRLDYLQQAIPEALTTRLAESGNLNIVERSRLDDAIKEMKLGMVGLVDQNEAAEIGKAVGANAIMVGSFLEISNVIRLNARLIDVQTSQVLIAKTVQGQVGAEIFNLMDGLAKSIEEQLIGKKVEPEPEPTPPPQPQPQPAPASKKGGSKTGLYILGGAVAAAGITAAVLLLSKKEKTSTNVKIIVPLGDGR